MLHGLEIEPRDTLPQAEALEPVEPETYDRRIALYRLLGAVFLEEPSAEFIDALRTSEALDALAEAGLVFDDDFLAAARDELVDTLAAEYATLFTASGGFPPVESVRLNGRYQQEPYHLIRQVYQRMGFVVVPGRFRVFEDQLGVELGFVAELLARGERARAAGDEAAESRWQREVKRFWVLHLGKWVRGYARLVVRAAEHSYYREMARLLEAFAESEIATLGLRMEDTDQAREVVPKAEVEVAFNPEEPVCNACSGSD